jgi:hypothetical protein
VTGEGGGPTISEYTLEHVGAFERLALDP